MNSLVFAVSLVAGAHAAMDLSVRSSIEAKLGVGGSVNCGYKCELTWNQRQDWGSGFALNEYIACVQGCEVCNGGKNKACMPTCKDTLWIAYAYYFNPQTKHQGRVENDAIVAPLKECIATCVDTKCTPPKCPGFGAGFDGNLPKKFTKCTKACYNTHLDTVQQQSFKKCQDEAAKVGYSPDDCAVGLVKGVVEPDKACIQGCSQNLCQAGAQCNGKGYWVAGGSPSETGCSLITPQTMGVRNTITPSYFNQQNDLGDCCNAAFQRCSYVVNPPTYPESFGVSLGRVIATSVDQCQMPGSTDVYGDVIQNSGNFECNCKNFFEQCPNAMSEGSIPANWKCNFGNGQSCSSAADCQNAAPLVVEDPAED